MRPILFVWRGIAIRSFQVMVYATLLTIVFVAVPLARADGLDADRTAAAIVVLFIPGFIGARLLYAARHWDHFRGEPMRLLRRSEGGLSLYGGLLGVLLASFPALWLFDLAFAPFWDDLVIGMLAGLVVAKGGCLLNGCCFGRPTDHWCAVHLPDDKGLWRRRFPSQPIEMVWAGLVFLLMLALRGVAPPAGAVACAAVTLQSLGRVFLQQLRDEDAAEDAAVRKTCLLFAGAGLVAGLAIWLQ